MSILLMWVLIVTGTIIGYILGSMFPALGLRVRVINFERKVEAHIEQQLRSGRIMTQNEVERVKYQFREFFNKL